MGEPRKERLLAATGMMKPLHHEEFPLHGVMGLIQQRAGHRHLGVCKHRIPTRLLVLHPASHALAIDWSSSGGDVVHKVAEPLPQRKHRKLLRWRAL